MSSPVEARARAQPPVADAPSRATGFTRTAVVLHWLMALLILCSVSLGAYMVDLHVSPRKVRLFAYHKWIGITLLGLVLPLVYLLFWLLNRALPFRVDPDGERIGMDLHELGGGAYPEFVIHRDESYR